MNDIIYSIIIPIKDEEENIQQLYTEINSSMERIDKRWECIWIDDGSRDNSLEILKKICKEDNRHKFISFKENMGQSAALFAGFKRARGEILLTMDGDGQNDPADFPKLLEVLKEKGVDFVTGYRKNRQDSLIKKVSSKIGNFFRTLVTGKTVRDAGCAIKVFKRECVEFLPPFKGMHRFFATIIHHQGFSWEELPVNHRPRFRGTSKYNISNRLWVGILDLIGIWWFRKRTFRYEITQVSNDLK
ncbi:glycosyltransferase family 2 protein [Desulfothermus okinawensis JCM 13304]